MNNKDTIAILMAAYNGEKYICHQVESIRNQSYTNWHLFIRDDCSSDKTLTVINKYLEKDERITVVDSQNTHLGACLNFDALIRTVIRLGYEYIMFSDQDDIWKNDKIEKSLKVYKTIENEKGKNMPILIHTNFQYVDENLKVIKFDHSSVFRRLSAHKNKIKILANYNYIFGCTVLLNKALLTLCCPIPPEAENHDYWIALHAAIFGTIVYLDEKTMLYRQHNNTVSGGIKFSYWKNRISRILTFQKYIENRRRSLLQFQIFVSKQSNIILLEELELFRQYINYSQKGGLFAAIFIIRHGYKSRGILQTLILYLTIIIDKRW